MSIVKKLLVNQITVEANGMVLVQLAKVLEEDGVVLSQEWHRTSIEPGEDVDAHMADIAAHMATPERGRFPTPAAADLARVHTLAYAAQTAPVVAAWKAKQAANAGRPKP